MTRLIALGFATLLFVTACSSGNVTTTSSSTEAAPARMRFTVETLTPAACARSAMVGRFMNALRVSKCH